MSKQELLDILAACARDTDRQGAMADAGDALLVFINDIEIADAYDAATKVST